VVFFSHPNLSIITLGNETRSIFLSTNIRSPVRHNGLFKGANPSPDGADDCKDECEDDADDEDEDDDEEGMCLKDGEFCFRSSGRVPGGIGPLSKSVVT